MLLPKATGELYCNVYSEIYGLPTISLRYFNVFGQRQDPKSQYAAVIPIFIDKLLKNESPVIYGDGEQTRDFVNVKEVVEANFFLHNPVKLVCSILDLERVPPLTSSLKLLKIPW